MAGVRLLFLRGLGALTLSVLGGWWVYGAERSHGRCAGKCAIELG